MHESPRDEYEDKLAALRKSVEERAAQNESLHDRTAAAIDNSVRIQEQRLQTKIDEARERGDDDAVKEAGEKLDGIPGVRKQQEAFEADRYAVERSAVDNERRAIDEMAARHQAERAELDKQFASERSSQEQRWADEKNAVAEPVRDPQADLVTRAIDMAPAVYEVVKLAVPETTVHLPDIESEKMAETLKSGYQQLKAELPDSARDMLPTDGRIDAMARESVQEGREHPTAQNQAMEEAHRNDVDRAPAEQQRELSEDLRTQQVAELDQRLERNEIPR